MVSLLAAPGMTVTAGLELAVLVPSVMSVAVIVGLPTVLRVTLKVFVPADNAALAGRTALASLEVIPTVWVLLTMFQFASTALAVTLNAVPAIWALGVPILPVALPGAAVSPGTNNCIFTNTPAFTVRDGLVLAVLLVSLASLAVTVRLPAVFRLTLKVCVPATRAALAGSAALASEDVIPIMSVTVVTRFQFASTALTVTLKAVPAFWAVGVPVLPVAVPGAAVSPGTSSCSFTKAPVLTVMEGLVLAILAGSLRSEPVKVCEPAAFKVTLRVRVPETKAAFAGRSAPMSLDVMPTVSVTVLTRFQKASTALTVTLKALPATVEVGVPVLPLAVPGAAVSPGTRSWSFAKAAGLTTTLAEVALDRPLAVKFSVMVLARL